MALLLLLFILSAWAYAEITKKPEIIVTATSAVKAADGDSFVIGEQKFRLRGIDALEWKQTCKDERNADWPCGKAAHKALNKLLAEPGLKCIAGAHDKYGRSLVTCATSMKPDLAAQQVRDGFAISNAFNGIRDYGTLEDLARAEKRGIWRGTFKDPKDYRAANSAAPRP